MFFPFKRILRFDEPTLRPHTRGVGALLPREVALNVCSGELPRSAMDLTSRYSRGASARSVSPREERSGRSPGRSGAWSRRSPQRGAAAASRLYQQDTVASRGRLRSRSRSPTPPMDRRKLADPPATAAEALLDAIEDRKALLDGRTFRDARAFFEIVDTRGSGAITPSELREALVRLDLGIRRAELRACYDIGKGSTIELPELERWLQKGAGGQRDLRRSRGRQPSSPSRRRRSSGSTRAGKALARRLSQSVPADVASVIGQHRFKVTSAFARVDGRGTGTLTAAKFEEGLRLLTGTVLTKPQVRLLMSELDKVGDGRDTVDYCQFVDEVVRISEMTSDDTSSDFTDDHRERERARSRSVSTDADSVSRFARHGLAAYEDADSSDEIIADLQRQVRLLRDQRDEYMRSRTSTSFSGKTRARQLRNHMKAGRLQGTRQLSKVFWAFAKWKQVAAEKTHEEAASSFSGQWHIVGRDHDGLDVEEWLVLWVGRAGDIYGEFFTRPSADDVAVQLSVLEGGDLVGRRLRFTQLYPHSAQRTQWELTAKAGRGQLSGIWRGDATGEFTAERCQIWVDSCEPQPQATPRGIYTDNRSRRTHSRSPSDGRGRSSPQHRRTAARRLAHGVTEDIADTMYENRMSLSSTFHRIDKTRSGSLSAVEFREGLHSLTGTVLTKPQVRLLMSELDKVGDGRVDYEELLAAVTRATDARRLARSLSEQSRQSIHMNRQRLLETFHDCDANDDGVLSAKEVQRGLRACGIQLLPSEVEQLMRVVDTDGNGTVDYCEFVEAALHLGSASTDQADMVDAGDRHYSPPRLTLRTSSADDDSPRSTGSPRQRSARRGGTPALIGAIAQRLDEIDGWRTKHLFRPLSRAHAAHSEAHALLEQLEGGRAMTSVSISHDVVAQTKDPYTLAALLYAWLLELHDSPIPKTMFQDCKIVSERPQHAHTALIQLVKDIPEPGQSILRAVIALYRRHDPDALDTVAIDSGLAPAVMHSPQGADQKWNHGDFVAVLLRELPDPSDFEHGHGRSSPISPSGVPRQKRVSPFARGGTHSSKAQGGDSPRRQRHSPSSSMFSSCQGRLNSGDGDSRSRPRGNVGSSLTRPKRTPTPFGPPRVTGTG